MPDVVIKDLPVSMIASALYSKNYLFDYATDYARQHPTIADAAKFSLTEDEFGKFGKWLESKDYSYKTETETALDSLKGTAIREHYYDASKDEFEALRAKLSHDKKQDLMKHKEQVKQMLENEIASRYYYTRGRIAQSLQYDKELEKAIALINQPSEYSALLRSGK